MRYRFQIIVSQKKDLILRLPGNFLGAPDMLRKFYGMNLTLKQILWVLIINLFFQLAYLPVQDVWDQTAFLPVLNHL